MKMTILTKNAGVLRINSHSNSHSVHNERRGRDTRCRHRRRPRGCHLQVYRQARPSEEPGMRCVRMEGVRVRGEKMRGEKVREGRVRG